MRQPRRAVDHPGHLPQPGQPRVPQRQLPADVALDDPARRVIAERALRRVLHKLHRWQRAQSARRRGRHLRVNQPLAADEVRVEDISLGRCERRGDLACLLALKEHDHDLAHAAIVQVLAIDRLVRPRCQLRVDLPFGAVFADPLDKRERPQRVKAICIQRLDPGIRGQVTCQAQTRQGQRLVPRGSHRAVELHHVPAGREAGVGQEQVLVGYRLNVAGPQLQNALARRVRGHVNTRRGQTAHAQKRGNHAELHIPAGRWGRQRRTSISHPRLRSNLPGHGPSAGRTPQPDNASLTQAALRATIRTRKGPNPGNRRLREAGAIRSGNSAVLV